VTQMASVAELEAGLISERTKAALAAAKARGVKLGNPNGEPARQAGRQEADLIVCDVTPNVFNELGIRHALRRKRSLLIKVNVLPARLWDLESWCARFLVRAGTCKLLRLSGRKDLPRWLRGSRLNLWERGNRWMLEGGTRDGAG
jgi:hypothetical protein